MPHIRRPNYRRRSEAAPDARTQFDAWRRQRRNPGMLLLSGAPRVIDGVVTSTKPLAIPLFSDHDLDSLIGALSEPTGEADR